MCFITNATISSKGGELHCFAPCNKLQNNKQLQLGRCSPLTAAWKHCQQEHAGCAVHLVPTSSTQCMIQLFIMTNGSPTAFLNLPRTIALRSRANQTGLQPGCSAPTT
jgi:hypothetical protein